MIKKQLVAVTIPPVKPVANEDIGLVIHAKHLNHFPWMSQAIQRNLFFMIVHFPLLQEMNAKRLQVTIQIQSTKRSKQHCLKSQVAQLNNWVANKKHSLTTNPQLNNRAANKKLSLTVSLHRFMNIQEATSHLLRLLRMLLLVGLPFLHGMKATRPEKIQARPILRHGKLGDHNTHTRHHLPMLRPLLTIPHKATIIIRILKEENIAVKLIIRRHTTTHHHQIFHHRPTGGITDTRIARDILHHTAGLGRTTSIVTGPLMITMVKAATTLKAAANMIVVVGEMGHHGDRRGKGKFLGGEENHQLHEGRGGLRINSLLHFS